MKGKRLSIKDIAAALNVSVTTVSFVLNGKAKEKRISDEVSKRVLEYCKKVNYKPNILAQSLRTGESKILVFMVEDISNYFFAKLARYFEDLAYTNGYKMLFCSNENSDKKSNELIRLFSERHVDGYIIVPSPNLSEKVKELEEQGIPVVLLDRYFEGFEADYVGIYNDKASEMGMKHLVANGFTKTLFVSTQSTQTQMLGRLQGYKNAAEANKMDEKILLLSYDFLEKELVKEELKKFFEANNDADSILFATNYLAKLGLSVLKNISSTKLHQMGIITFDNHYLFDITCPSITAIDQPLEAMASETMNLLFNKLKNRNMPPEPKSVVLDTQLIVRDSTLPIAERTL
ncbi:LacI family transcriptional regulator [Pustulibacterium marinum]|uniref:LacI family transcriptional regulator n=1 Tax=Pustulibacterium marinum TaxID=1224947 RepID=A0A1I7H110_9FLAO|nr:LacI family DNA-binding transcriptional regulator [Pustulibacterium marinum]SFU54166.1 LacI family transcriptional regulator [Pustulibacterium marinum]